MKHYAALLFAALFAGCQSNRPPVNLSGPVSITGFDERGNQTVTSYAGRTGAGSGTVNDTAEAEIVKALAAKLEGKEFTYASATRSAVVQPDTNVDVELETKHKAALQDAAQALAAGAGGKYAQAASLAADLGAQLIQARAAKANRPQADSGAISTRILSSGEGHAQAAAIGIQTFGATLQAAKRANYQGSLDRSTTDTTSAADWEAIAKTFEALKKPLVIPPAVAPVAPPIVFPPLPVADPDMTKGTPSPFTNTVETITLPELPK